VALVSACVAALSVAACNNSASSQNGAYVGGATNASLPVSGQSLPPSSEYQAVSQTPPPSLPVYDQPPIPGPGYVWTPGYWDWSDDADDYYWVPGTWVEPPAVGLLWTPGYWRYYNGSYLFSDGYWGPQVGFYGGVDYGYGYSGNGYEGGRWQGNQFYYNSLANNLGSRQIDATYSQVVAESANRVSFNGGPGGLRVAPVAANIAAAQEQHAPPTRDQRDQVRIASAQPQLRASVNRGAPPIAATARPAAFHAGAIAARSPGDYAAPARQGPAGGFAQSGPSGPALGGAAKTPAQVSGAAGARPTEMAAAAPAERSALRAQPPETVAPPPMRTAAPQTHAHEVRAAAPAQPAPQQHASQAHAAPPPRSAAHAVAPAPGDSRDHHG
jgi:hypothetical protein